MSDVVLVHVTSGIIYLVAVGSAHGAHVSGK